MNAETDRLWAHAEAVNLVLGNVREAARIHVVRFPNGCPHRECDLCNMKHGDDREIK